MSQNTIEITHHPSGAKSLDQSTMYTISALKFTFMFRVTKHPTHIVIRLTEARKVSYYIFKSCMIPCVITVY